MKREIPFADLSSEQQERATRKLLAAAARARKDPKFFFQFVMREERTRSHVACAPHQRVLFDFVMAHPRCVVRMPAGASKTYCMAALTMWLTGQDPTVRGAIVSATQLQAAKPLAMVRDYIEESVELKIVFPGLNRSTRLQDPWTQTAITVARPPAIRDPTLVAVGIDGALPGARLAWCIVDDVLDRENTSTPAGRQKVLEFFTSVVLARLDPTDSRIVVTNTPWHPDDVTYKLEAAGWPTLTMDIEGNIAIANADKWDTDDIRGGKRPGEWYRLSAHDPDEDEEIPLWPARFSAQRIDELRVEYSNTPHRFNQLYLCQCRDDETARCKLDWIEQCKKPGLSMVSAYKGTNPVVTGVDLAVGETESHDTTAFFTFEILPTGKRRILDIENGHYDGPTIVDKLIRKAQQFNSIVRVESNAAQAYIRQFALARHASIPVKAHQTGRANKHSLLFGVESLFVELQNGGWEIPCDAFGRCPRAVQRWIDECIFYEPSKHTGDILVACWLAREQARGLGLAIGSQQNQSSGIGMKPSLAAGIMAR